MSFLRHEEIYRCAQLDGRKGAISAGATGEGAILANHAPAHRHDESPAGYSSVGCSPAFPPSASPATAILVGTIRNAKDFAVDGTLSLITVSHPWGSLHRVLISLLPTQDSKF
jgi:hypothetical protein